MSSYSDKEDPVYILATAEPAVIVSALNGYLLGEFGAWRAPFDYSLLVERFIMDDSKHLVLPTWQYMFEGGNSFIHFADLGEIRFSYSYTSRYSAEGRYGSNTVHAERLAKYIGAAHMVNV